MILCCLYFHKTLMKHHNHPSNLVLCPTFMTHSYKRFDKNIGWFQLIWSIYQYKQKQDSLHAASKCVLQLDPMTVMLYHLISNSYIQKYNQLSPTCSLSHLPFMLPREEPSPKHVHFLFLSFTRAPLSHTSCSHPSH